MQRRRLAVVTVVLFFRNIRRKKFAHYFRVRNDLRNFSSHLRHVAYLHARVL